MRRDEAQSNAVGHDSFLDVVTNMVAILIILVMVVGMRIRNAPQEAVPDATADAAAASFVKDQSEETSIRRDLAESAQRIDVLKQEAMLRQGEREMLVSMAAAAEVEIQSRRDRLDADAKADFDVNRRQEEARRTLAQLEASRRNAEETVDRWPIVVESLPTPLGKKVFGEEAFFQIRQGHIVSVPIAKLMELARADAIRKADKIFGEKGMPQFTETVGPVEGFRLRYTVERREWSEKSDRGPVRHIGFQMIQGAVLPADSRLGESLEAALADGSQFRAAVSKLRPDQVTVTLWVYNDSFATFRELRKEFYRLGFPVAARPLPAGMLITFSPHGTRSETE